MTWNRTGSLLTPPCPNTSKGGEKTGWGEWEKERTKQWKTIRDDPDSLPIAALKFIWIPIFPKWVFFVSQKACTCIFLCEHMHVSMCAGKCVFTAWVSFATRRMFHFWFQFSFPFFFLFYFLKIIFPFRNMFIRKPAPLPPRRTGHSHLFLNRADFPSHPETGTPQDGLRRLESLPVWRNALVAVKAPLPQWRFLIVGHSLVFVFFLSSN